ncbi:AMP-binding protein [Mesonia aestuariivivens]|uniref:AMP-binding protein n=1 Tax=Mesonia aestuariivivens TaxID=2796128 RepID=A0ABS6W2G4_9FLAO|nr:AMP-binding protein [Mesonia aestuariivivens]MBW2962046.1 AMP-binding protein [Mesonia aestuariivivens]
MNEFADYYTPRLHEDFQFNKNKLNETGLIQLANLYINEGEPYEESIGEFILDWLDEKEYVEVKTSGSTGTPKIVQVKKEYMVNSAKATGKFFKLPEQTTALLCLPASYIAGKMMLVRAMVLGWHLDSVQPKSNPIDQVFKRYDFCAMTPFQLDNSLGRLHLIQKLIVGGGAVSVHLKQLVQGIPTKIYETYGMTETVTHIAARRINSKKSRKKKLPFKVLANVTVAQDDRNCLTIKAPLVSDQLVVTNDVVELITYKKFFWKGRIDNVINSGGVKIHPEEVEKKLQNIILQRFFVTSLPDDALGEKLILFVEAAFSEEVLEHLKEEIQKSKKIDKFEKPKKIYFVEKFEETHTGKVNRINTLKARLA